MKRFAIAATVTVALLAAFVPGAAAAAGSTAWGQSDGDAAMNRDNPTEDTVTAATVARVRLLRTVQRAGDLSPVLSGNRIYTATEDGVSAVNASTGALVWQYAIPDRDGCVCYRWHGLSVADGIVFAGGSDQDSVSAPGGGVFALDASTGVRIWSVGESEIPVLSLAVSAGYLVAYGNSEQGAFVEVLRASTGSTVWSKTGDECSYTMAAVIGGNVIWPHCDDPAWPSTALEADLLATGAPVWSRSGTWVVQRGDDDSPTAGHHVYAADETGVVRDLNPKSGATRLTLPGAVDVLAVDSAHVFATCATGLCGYDVTAGGRQWTQSVSATQATAAAGVLYVDNTARSAQTGQVVRSFPAGSFVTSVGNGRVAMRTPTGLAVFGLPGY